MTSLVSAATASREAPSSDHHLDFALPDGTLATLAQELDRLGDVFRMRSTREAHWAYLFNSATAAEHVLGPGYRGYRKGMGIDRVNILLGRGLMVSEGDFWKTQRRMIQPGFRRRAARQWFAVALECSEAFAADREFGAEFDLADAMSRTTLQFVLRALFGSDLTRLMDDDGESIFALVHDETARDLQFARRFRALAQPVADLLQRRRSDDVARDDWLDLLMQARDRDGEPMSGRQIVDEVLTLIIAGHETTAAGLTWTWLLLAEHPAVAAKLRAELDQVLAGAPLTEDCIPKLTYTRQIIDEALRLYPPGWMLARRALEDDTVDGIAVPAGSDVLISPYLLHRNPRYWTDPDSFDPERFSAAVNESRPRYAYLPFSAGARNCIGEHVARLEMVVHLAVVARKMRLRRAEPGPIAMEAQINLRPRGNVAMTAYAHD